MSLVDLSLDVKPYLEIPDSDTSSDDVLGLCMEAASAYCERYTGRILEEQDLTETANGNGTHSLVIRAFPITTISRISIDADWQFLDALDPSEYIVNNECFVVRKLVWPQGIQNIQLTLTAGYAYDDVPADLTQINLHLVEFFYHSRSDHRLGVVNRNKIGETLTFTESVPKTITDMLAPYVWETATKSLLRRNNG